MNSKHVILVGLLHSWRCRADGRGPGACRLRHDQRQSDLHRHACKAKAHRHVQRAYVCFKQHATPITTETVVTGTQQRFG